MEQASSAEAGCCWISPTPESTFALGEALGRLLAADPPGDATVLGLCGELGSGKTLFTQGLAAGLGIDPTAVASPTFTIVSEYPLSFGTFAHLDLYRLESAAELEAVGFVDLLEPGAVVAIEWADRFPEALPADRLTLRFTRDALVSKREVGNATAPERSRRIEAAPAGAGARGLLGQWAAAVAAAPASEPLGAITPAGSPR